MRMDDALVAAAVQGDRDAQSKLLAAVLPRLRKLALDRFDAADDRSDAIEDVAQNAIIALADGLKGLRRQTVEGVMAYASRILDHKIADSIRRRPQSGTIALDASDAGNGSLRDRLPCTGTTPSKAASRSDDYGRVRDILARMRDADREIVSLAFFEQLSTAEIASRLGIAREAASMRLLRALRVLQSALERERSEVDGS